jgi:hypothetical protein
MHHLQNYFIPFRLNGLVQSKVKLTPFYFINHLYVNEILKLIYFHHFKPLHQEKVK